MAEGLNCAGTVEARCRARRRGSCTASVPNLPPTSRPTTTRRQRRARSSSGYVWCRLRRAAAETAADALPVIGARAPAFAHTCLAALEGQCGEAACLREAAAARDLLRHKGWRDCPAWSCLLQGSCPTPADDAGLGDWPHGWQMHASRTRNTHFRECVLPAMSPSSQALLRSQAGPQAGAWLAAIPTEPATTMPLAMQLALRRRLRQPLPLRRSVCGPKPWCGANVDCFSDHALACPRMGLLARRAKLVKRAWVRVAREALGESGGGRPGRPGTVAGPNHCPRCRSKGQVPARSRRVWSDVQWRRLVLRCHTCLALDTNRSPATLCSGGRWSSAAGGRTPKARYLPKAFIRAAKARRAGLGGRRSLE